MPIPACLLWEALNVQGDVLQQFSVSVTLLAQFPLTQLSMTNSKTFAKST